MSEREGNVARAAAQIERAVTGRNPGQFRDTTFPISVQSETLEVVDEVVTAGDARKEIVDLRGARFAGRVKNIAHAPSLAVAGGRGKA
jgi:hypothetical protein